MTADLEAALRETLDVADRRRALRNEIRDALERDDRDAVVRCAAELVGFPASQKEVAEHEASGRAPARLERGASRAR